ncbi:hypothetical protein KCU95_g13157, partial [Aureobasidium melanogenum]
MGRTVKGEGMRNIPLEKNLIELGVSEEEIRNMTKIQQSNKYNAMIQEIVDMPRSCAKCFAPELRSEIAGWYCPRCFR